MRLAASLLLFCACGRYDFARIDTPDAPAPADADAATWPTGPFSPPQVVAALAEPGHDDDPTATGDALEMYYQTDLLGAAGGFADIYTSTRATTSDVWSAATVATALNSVDEDQAPGITADGLTIYFSSRRTGGPGGAMNSNIWVSTRATRSDAWTTPVVDPNLSSTLDDFEPQPDASNTHLVLYRSIDATNKDLYEASRPDTASPWGTPVALNELDTAGAERSPFLSPDGLTIYFSSDRSSTMAGVDDMFVATRASTAQPFDPPTLASELNTASDDDDPWISTDGRDLLMTSDRSGNYEIYEARR